MPVFSLTPLSFLKLSADFSPPSYSLSGRGLTLYPRIALNLAILLQPPTCWDTGVIHYVTFPFTLEPSPKGAVPPQGSTRAALAQSPPPLWHWLWRAALSPFLVLVRSVLDPTVSPSRMLHLYLFRCQNALVLFSCLTGCSPGASSLPV